MPPQLALLLCTAFVVYLFRADKDKDIDSYKPSLGLLLPTLWLLYSGSRELVYWFGNGFITDNGSTIEEGSQIDRLFLCTLIALSVVVLSRRNLNWRTVVDRNRALVLLYGYAFISIGWSEFPFSSFKRFIRLGGGVLMALVILTETSPREALETVFKRMVYILIPFSMVLIKYYPNLGVVYRAHSGGKSWVGVTLSKNQLGILCMVSAFFLVWRFFTKRKILARHRTFVETGTYFLLFGLCLYLMLGEGAYSATAMACLPASIITFYLLTRAQRRSARVSTKALLIPITVIFLLGASLPFLGTSPVAGITDLLGRDATFTSRTDIWNILRPFAEEAPILGHGYGGFWSESVIRLAEVNEAHNGYLEVILILGIPGLIVLFGYLASCCRHVQRSLAWGYNADWAIFGFCFIVLLVLHEATEASFLAETDLLWTCMIFLTMSYESVEVSEEFETEEEETGELPYAEEARI